MLAFYLAVFFGVGGVCGGGVKRMSEEAWKV